ncbi:hypothetical protein MRX96_025302 [Rhipicephalus microplus]
MNETFAGVLRACLTPARCPDSQGTTSMRARSPMEAGRACLGMISRNEADLAIGPILPTIARFGVAEPLPQYYFIRLTTCAGTKRLFKTDVFGYVTALDSQARAFLYSVLHAI